MGMVMVMSEMVESIAHPEINGTAGPGAVSNRVAPFSCFLRLTE